MNAKVGLKEGSKDEAPFVFKHCIMNKHRGMEAQFHASWNSTLYKCKWWTWGSGRIITYETAQTTYWFWDGGVLAVRFKAMGGECKECCLGCYPSHSGRHSPKFRRKILLLSSGQNISPKMEGVGSYKRCYTSTRLHDISTLLDHIGSQASTLLQFMELTQHLRVEK